jgi:Spy/CpxP family protein refolding chaperone
MTRSATVALAVLSVALALPATGQHTGPNGGHHHPGGAHGGGAPAQPYAGLAERRIKALPEEHVAGLLAGRGMALALAAELNGYPGPMHVLEHADALRLTPEQRRTAEALRDRMQAEARTLGARIVALEEELEGLFATGAADAGRVAALTASVGALNGRLRETHLVTHIAIRDALDPAQLAAYARLRGYAGAR